MVLEPVIEQDGNIWNQINSNRCNCEFILHRIFPAINIIMVCALVYFVVVWYWLDLFTYHMNPLWKDDIILSRKCKTKLHAYFVFCIGREVILIQQCQYKNWHAVSPFVQNLFHQTSKYIWNIYNISVLRGMLKTFLMKDKVQYGLHWAHAP